MSKYPPAEWYTADKCIQCGACCHQDGVPCEHLQVASEAKTECEVYFNRLGWHQTIEGRRLLCVPIRHEIEKGKAPEHCGYVKAMVAETNQ